METKPNKLTQSVLMDRRELNLRKPNKNNQICRISARGKAPVKNKPTAMKIYYFASCVFPQFSQGEAAAAAVELCIMVQGTNFTFNGITLAVHKRAPKSLQIKVRTTSWFEVSAANNQLPSHGLRNTFAFQQGLKSGLY